MIKQRLLKCREAEEPVGLTDRLNRPAMDGAALLPGIVTLTVDQVSGQLEFLTADAVRTLKVPLVNVAGVLQPREEPLHAFGVTRLRGADEVVIGCVDGVENRQPRVCHESVSPCLGGDAIGLRCPHDLLTMLIGAREEPDILSAHPVPARQDIAGRRRVRVPDVGSVVDVVDRRGQVERLGLRGHAWSLGGCAAVLGRHHKGIDLATWAARLSSHCRDRGGLGLALGSTFPHAGHQLAVTHLRGCALRCASDNESDLPAKLTDLLRQVAQWATDDLLVHLGEFPTDCCMALTTEAVSEVHERLTDPLRGLEEDHRAPLRHQSGQPLASVMTASGKEPLEAEPVDRQTTDGQCHQHGTRTGNGGDLMTCVQSSVDEAVSRITDNRCPSVRDKNDHATFVEIPQQPRDALMFNGVVVGDDTRMRRQTQSGQQGAQSAGVLGGDDIRCFENAHKPCRGVPEMADRRRSHHQTPAHMPILPVMVPSPDVAASPAASAIPDTGVSSPGAVSRGDRDVADVQASLRPRVLADGIGGWAGPLAATAVAALLRWPRLGEPGELVFDETYYAKDALSLLRFGYERAFIDNANDIIVASDGAIGALNVFKEQAAYVVHPPLGKWVIALGEQIFGMTPFGWRFSVALLGTLTVLLIARIVRRISGSTLIGTIAGLLMALDGMGIVMSRTALLDGILTFFVVAGIGALILDRDDLRSRLMRRLEHDPAELSRWRTSLGPTVLVRPWLWVAGLMLGAAVATKWSALWHIALFGLLMTAWGLGVRRGLGVRHPWWGAALRDGLPALVPLVLFPALIYVASWWGWFASDSAWDRMWAASNPSTMGWIPDALRSWWHYQTQAWNFHVGLTSEHSYQANAWTWPLMGRPTSFFYEDPGTCGGGQCSQEVLALGNPLIWWTGVLALVHQMWRWLAMRQWGSGVVVLGFAAGWVPWLLFQERTIFTFYAIVVTPFLVAAIAMSIGALLRDAKDAEQRRRRLVMTGMYLVAVVVLTWFFLPIWVGETLPYDEWRWRMWFPTWI